MLNEGYGFGLFGGSVGLGNVCWLGSLPSYLCFIMQPMFYFFYLLVVGEIYQSPVMCAGDWWGHRTRNIIYARI
jgi:hypothetical protein